MACTPLVQLPHVTGRILGMTFAGLRKRSADRGVTSIEAEEAVASSLFGINKNMNVTLE